MVTISQSHEDRRPASLWIADFFETAANRLRDGYVWRRNYRQTYNELSGLLDRDLHDLGISRANIEQVAADSARAAVRKAAAERR